MFPRILVPATLVAVLAAGQSPSGATVPNPDARADALHKWEAAADHKSVKKEAAADERRQNELYGKLSEFAESWNRLMQLAQKGVWNAKQAKKTREAFERLVRSNAWTEDTKVAQKVAQ